jgi:hypothetical protein
VRQQVRRVIEAGGVVVCHRLAQEGNRRAVGWPEVAEPPSLCRCELVACTLADAVGYVVAVERAHKAEPER